MSCDCQNDGIGPAVTDKRGASGLKLAGGMGEVVQVVRQFVHLVECRFARMCKNGK